MNIGSMLTSAGAGITLLTANDAKENLYHSVHSDSGRAGVIIFFYGDNCPHSQNMVQPFIQLAKSTPGIKFQGFNALGSKAQNDLASVHYAAVLPTFFSFKCDQGFGAFSGENKDSLNKLVSYLNSKDIKC